MAHCVSSRITVLSLNLSFPACLPLSSSPFRHEASPNPARGSSPAECVAEPRPQTHFGDILSTRNVSADNGFCCFMRFTMLQMKRICITTCQNLPLLMMLRSFYFYAALLRRPLTRYTPPYLCPSVLLSVTCGVPTVNSKICLVALTFKLREEITHIKSKRQNNCDLMEGRISRGHAPHLLK